MKGIVFTEFLSFIESRHDLDMVDDVIAESGLQDQAHFTAVGTYDFALLAKLLGSYCQITGHSAPETLQDFGRHLCAMFQRKFPAHFTNNASVLDFLTQLDGHIHVEVRKLYPDAELPRFEIVDHRNRTMRMKYVSCRPLADLAEGLISATASHYNERVAIRRERHENGDSHYHSFEIEILPAA